MRLLDLARDGGLDPESAAGRAAVLLQQLPKAPTLSPSALARIEEELLQRTAPQAQPLSWLRHLGWGLAAVSTVTASFVVGLSMRPQPPKASEVAALQLPRAVDIHEVRLPSDSQARLSVGQGGLLTVDGPGTLSLQGTQVRFQQGRLRVDNGNQQLLIQIGMRQVTVAARASASLSAHLGELVQIAAYVGSVEVRETTSAGTVQDFTVAAGATWPVPQASAPTLTPEPLAPSTQPTTQRLATRGLRPTPAVNHKPALTPTLTPPPAPTPAPQSRLLAESQLLGRALQRLHRDRDARGALAALDEYSTQFADGTLSEEASAARVDALLQLNQRSEALRVLDEASFTKLARGGELRLLRGELRAHAGRCREAVADFDAAQKLDRRSGSPLAERALYGLATCRLQLGERGLAKEALRRYLDAYPAGRFADAAREALGQL